MPRLTAVRIVAALLLLAAIVACLLLLPVPQYAETFVRQIRSLGPWGPVLLVLLYVVACLAFLPSSALTLAAGFMYGLFWGSVVASLGATLGATAAFLVGRFLVRGWIERHLAGHPAFQAADSAIETQGFKIVLLTRMSSLFPYDLMSYSFGLTRVPTRRYIVATWLGRLPETLLFAYLGSTAKSLTEVFAGKAKLAASEPILLGLSVAAMIAVAVIVGRIARRALQEAVSNEKTPDGPR
jgi:uncharacterized membrane protein YdjX (TVP38/TMEM64 family)